MYIRQAPLTIDIAIVGGSIGGLAAAYALARHGHRVHVFEKAAGKPQRSAGIRVPPNLDKLLREWGLDKEMEQASKTYRSDFYHQDNEHQGFLLWQQDVLREAGGDFCTMHWDQLYQILFNLAVSAGTDITFGATVANVVSDESGRPVLVFPDGSTFTADVVVGADGMKSKIRDIVNGYPHEPRRGFNDSDMTIYTLVVPSGKLRTDPDLRKLVDSPKGQFSLWLSDRRWLLGYPILQGKEYCVHATWHGEFSTQDEIEDWFDVVPTNSVELTGAHPMIQRLFTMSPDVMRSKYHNVHVEDWVDETGRIVLVAEAAHPIFPTAIHAQSLAVEDAVVLGTLFSRLSRWDQIPQLLDGFQELRQDRCRFVDMSEMATANVLSLPPGEARDARDVNLQLSLQSENDIWDEDMLLGQWDGIAAVFGYTAREAAEEWWVKWGLLDNRTSVFDMMNLGMHMHVQEVHSDA